MVKVPVKPTSRFGRITWHLHSPVVTLLLISALLESIPSCSTDRFTAPPGKMGYHVHFQGYLPSAETCLASAERYLVRNGSGSQFVVIDPDAANADELNRAATLRPQDVLLVSCQSTISMRGIWYPT